MPFYYKQNAFIRCIAWWHLVNVYPVCFSHFFFQSFSDSQATKDPGQDSQYAEHEVDVMRAQKKQVCCCCSIALHSQVFQRHKHCRIVEYTCFCLLPLNNLNFSSRTLQLGYVMVFVAVGGGRRVVGRELLDFKSFGSCGFFGSNSNFPSSSLPELFLQNNIETKQ